MAVSDNLLIVVFVCSLLLVNCSPNPHDAPIRNDQVGEAFQALMSYVDLAVQPLKEEIASLKAEMADMRNKHAVEIKHLRDELDTLSDALSQSDKHMDLENKMFEASIQRNAETHLQERLNKDKHNMPERNAQIQHIRRQVDDSRTHVAFFAKLSTHAKSLGVNQHVVFDNVVTNVGNGYDKNIGVFRAPVSGTYLISTTITTYIHDNAHFGIFINQRKETWFYLNGEGNTYDETSQTIIVHLNTGDDVSIRNIDEVSGALGQEHSLLSGALLFADDEQPALVGK